MANKNLGILQKVELREAWLSEATDFTPWLAQEENLKLLGDAIGIELELESQEKEVGPFRADILWSQQFEWLRQRLETMHKVFRQS